MNRDQAKHGFYTELVEKLGGMFEMPQFRMPQIGGHYSNENDDPANGLTGLERISRMSGQAQPHNFQRGQELATKGIEASKGSSVYDIGRKVLGTDPLYPTQDTRSNSVAAPMYAAENYQPTTKQVGIRPNGKPIMGVDTDKAPDLSIRWALNGILGDAAYKGDREANLQSPEFLQGANKVIGDKSYGLASMNNQGNAELHPGNIQWGNLWKDHKGMIMGGLGAAGLLAYLLFHNNQQQQQAPPIVINTGGYNQPQVPRNFGRF
jgi:hypothetical protein